ncbi:Tripartite tricarboxylate transporter family receptor [compost metagenome]
MAEAGLPGYEIAGWFGVLAPAATPKPVVERLNKELLAVLAMPDVREQIGAMGGIIAAGGPADFGRYIAAETDKWGALVRSAQIKIQ